MAPDHSPVYQEMLGEEIFCPAHVAQAFEAAQLDGRLGPVPWKGPCEGVSIPRAEGPLQARELRKTPQSPGLQRAEKASQTNEISRQARPQEGKHCLAVGGGFHGMAHKLVHLRLEGRERALQRI